MPLPDDLMFFYLVQAELGASAGLAYEWSFNQYGLRLCFRGLSQSLPSYARRFCRRLVMHHKRLFSGSVALSAPTIELATSQAERAYNAGEWRGKEIRKALFDSTARDAAREGRTFLNSCRGGMALAQGDILPTESVQLLDEIKGILSFSANDHRSLTVTKEVAERPDLRQILYRAMWKPRSSSPCYIPGICLISNACGRIQR